MVDENGVTEENVEAEKTNDDVVMDVDNVQQPQSNTSSAVESIWRYCCYAVTVTALRLCVLTLHSLKAF